MFFFFPPQRTFADQSNATIKTIAAARRCSAFMHQRWLNESTAICKADEFHTHWNKIQIGHNNLLEVKDSTLTENVWDDGSCLERNFSGWTITTWPGETLSSLATSALKEWRKVKSSLSELPASQTAVNTVNTYANPKELQRTEDEWYQNPEARGKNKKNCTLFLWNYLQASM